MRARTKKKKNWRIKRFEEQSVLFLVLKHKSDSIKRSFFFFFLFCFFSFSFFFFASTLYSSCQFSALVIFNGVSFSNTACISYCSYSKDLTSLPWKMSLRSYDFNNAKVLPFVPYLFSLTLVHPRDSYSLVFSSYSIFKN